MSTSIRPPGGFTSGVVGGGSLDGSSGLSGTEQSEGAGASSLEGSERSVASQGSAGAEAGRNEAVNASESSASRWIQRLESGEITRAEAMEGLVADAVQKHGGARLSPSMRSELEGVLRSALQNDPVLSRLLGDT